MCNFVAYKTNHNDMVTKRLFIALFSVFLMVSAYATNGKDLEKDVTMVSYEQGWLDREGTLALKNNTDKAIRNVVFQITYFDMSGKPLDYENYKEEVSIAPGMTKKLDIPAYEHSRHYHYYKSENMPTGSPAFKIKFQLIDYNVELPRVKDKYADEFLEEYANEYSDAKEYDYEKFGIIFGFITVLVAIGVSVGFYVLVAVMAQKRNRNAVIWVLLSILATPLLMIIILLCIGNSDRHIEDQYG